MSAQHEIRGHKYPGRYLYRIPVFLISLTKVYFILNSYYYTLLSLKIVVNLKHNSYIDMPLLHGSLPIMASEMLHLELLNVRVRS